MPIFKPEYVKPEAVAVFDEPSEHDMVYDVAPVPPDQFIVTLFVPIFVKLTDDTLLGGVVIGPAVVVCPYTVPEYGMSVKLYV